MAHVSPITSSIEIARPAEDVFAYVTDPSRFSEWQDDVVSARFETAQPPGVGSRFRTIRRMGRNERVVTQEITAYAPPTSWAARGIDGPVRPRVELTLQPLAHRSRVRLTVVMDFEAHGIGKVLVPLVIRRLAARQAPRSYQRLKEQLERQP